MHKKQTDGRRIPAKAAVKRLAAGGLSVLVAAASANGGLAVPVLAEDNHEILQEETVRVSDAADPENSGELVTEEAPEGRDSAGESQQPEVTEQPEITEIPQEQEENEEAETREEARSIPAASDAAAPQVVQAAPEAEPEIQAEVQVSTPLLIRRSWRIPIRRIRPPPAGQMLLNMWNFTMPQTGPYLWTAI